MSIVIELTEVVEYFRKRYKGKKLRVLDHPGEVFTILLINIESVQNSDCFSFCVLHN